MLVWILFLLLRLFCGLGAEEYRSIRAQGRQKLVIEGRSEPVMHFLFLVRDSLPNILLWDRFLAKAPHGKARIYLHCTMPELCLKQNFTEYPALQGIIRFAKTARTARGFIIDGEVQLLREALKYSSPHSADKYLLMTDSTIPLRPWDVVYSSLLQHPWSDFLLVHLVETGARTIDGASIQLVYHEGWWVLSRMDAVKFVDRIQPEAASKVLEMKATNVMHINFSNTRIGPFITKETENYLLDKDYPHVADELIVFATIWGSFLPGRSCPLDESRICNSFGDYLNLTSQRTFQMWYRHKEWHEQAKTLPPGDSDVDGEAVNPLTFTRLGPAGFSLLQSMSGPSALFFRKVRADCEFVNISAILQNYL